MTTKRLFLVCVTAACASAQSWKEFSIAPVTVPGKTGFSREGLRSEGAPLIDLIWRAYGIPQTRIVAPDWIYTERYAVTALVADPKNFQPLMQQKLAKQFSFAAHREPREVRAYAMRAIPGQEQKREQPCTEADSSQKKVSGLQTGLITATGLADQLSTMLDRPVVNETGINGRFSVCFQWANGQAPAALRERLGLDLVDTKATVDVLVVDHIDKLRAQQ